MIVLNKGTHKSNPVPKKKTTMLVRVDLPDFPGCDASGTLFLIVNVRKTSGTSRQKKLGRNEDLIIDKLVIWLPIQSMVVVTSPIGDHAPPAFTAMMTSPANTSRSSRFGNIFDKREIMTIVVVRLSKIADRKKLTNPTIHSNVRFLFPRKNAATQSNPSCASMISTIVIAPMRKNRMPAISATFSISSVLTILLSDGSSMHRVQQTTPVRMAVAALFTCNTFSSAIRQ